MGSFKNSVNSSGLQRNSLELRKLRTWSSNEPCWTLSNLQQAYLIAVLWMLKKFARRVRASFRVCLSSIWSSTFSFLSVNFAQMFWFPSENFNHEFFGVRFELRRNHCMVLLFPTWANNWHVNYSTIYTSILQQLINTEYLRNFTIFLVLCSR